ncbi:uncharacterized protein V6R79_015889 [Siganus canaliculatus]
MTKCKAPGFSFGIRRSEASSSLTPGPKYLIPSNVTRTGVDSAPAFSFHIRPEKRSYQSPGPGQYSPEHSLKMIFRSAPAFSLTAREQKKGKSAVKAPGPASYTLPPVLGPQTAATSAAPSFSIYSRGKNGDFSGDLAKSPGPAAYKVVSPCTYKQKPPQYSMTGRNFTPDERTKKPGPGAHYPENVTATRAKAPSFSFGVCHSQYVLPFIEKLTD